MDENVLMLFHWLQSSGIICNCEGFRDIQIISRAENSEDSIGQSTGLTNHEALLYNYLDSTSYSTYRRLPRLLADGYLRDYFALNNSPT